MSELLPVIGPLWLPSSMSGVHTPGCDHIAPNACSRCDGERLSGRDLDLLDARAIDPLCMRKEET